MEKLNTAKDVNKYITDYIKLADAKIGAYITLSTAFSAVLVPSIVKLFSATDVGCWKPVLILVFLMAIGSYVGTLFYCLNALSPNTKGATSLVSFPDINKLTNDEYIQKFNELKDDDALVNEYLKHNKTLSAIVMQKFANLSKATELCYFWIGAYVLLFVIQALIVK